MEDVAAARLAEMVGTGHGDLNRGDPAAFASHCRHRQPSYICPPKGGLSFQRRDYRGHSIHDLGVSSTNSSLGRSNAERLSYYSNTSMGTSKRYAQHYDGLMDARIADGVMRSGEPDTLDARELEFDNESMTRTPKPRPARAWVRYGDQSIEVDVEVVAWTERAIAIRWPGPEGSEHHAWVWGGAVGQRRAPR
jgi:hypothetical protein